jgi:ATP-dependent helicase/nuclease subunit A
VATDFTSAQLSAIEYRELDACVVAGPGAGKTTVLVERYRRLVEDRGFEPRQILAITFTEKAAANMKAKLAEKFEHDAVRRRDLEAGWVSTIHGFCMRLLRENAIAAGLDPRFEVLSPREADNLQWECLNGALDELTASHRESTLELIEALQSPSLAGDLKEVYDGIRSAGLTIADVRARPNPVSGAASDADCRRTA